MASLAAFDLGTNTVLMVVAEQDGAGRIHTLIDRGDIARLGEGVDRTHRLSPAAIARTIEVISRFADEARALGATRLVAAATSATRDAENGPQFAREVQARTGVEVRILSGDEEALLTFRAVQADFGAGAAELVAIDLGGGSTELIFGQGHGPPRFRRSLDVGSVRLTERQVSAHPIPLAEQHALRETVRAQLQPLPAAAPGATVVAVAATATTLSAVHQGLDSEADPRVQGSELPVEVLEELVPRLSGLSLEERRRVRGLDPRRADVVCAGGFILLETLRHLGARACRVSDRGVRYGLLYELTGGAAWR